MDAERSHMIDRILNLTLEIVYLLSGEKCAVVKMVSLEGLLQGMYPPMPEEWSRSPSMEPPPLSQISEKKNEKILEVTQKMMELLTGEVLVEKCRSVWQKVNMENRHTSFDLSGRVETIHTPNCHMETSDRCEEQNLFEGVVDEAVAVKEEDLLDGDCWNSRASALAEIMEDSADVSDTEKWPSIAHIKVEMKEIEFTSSIISEDKEDPLKPLITSSIPENRLVMERTRLVAQSALAPPSQSAAAMIYSCDSCKNTFISCSDFLHHRSTCQGPPSFFCTECGKCFARRKQLVRHCRIHTGLKRYTCPECDKSFRMKSQLVMHRRVHTGEKPYSCSDCGRGFARQQLLDSHKVVHSGERPFACSECQMTFSRTSYLIIHRRIHSGEKPYLCSECDRAFRTRSALIAHQRTHTGERPYHCLVCGKCYTHSSHLVVHQRSHSGEKPYSCMECGKCFSNKSGLVRHQRIHTRQ